MTDEHPDPMVAESRARDPLHTAVHRGPARSFRSKPKVIQAMQWDGTVEGATKIIDWVLANGGLARYHEAGFIAVDTLDAVGKVFRGDWMIRGTVGEFYPCVPDAFDASYEPVDEAPVPEMSDEGVGRLIEDLDL